MFITMSKLKRVCTMILIPRLFRGAGCTPGKFYRLKFDVIRKARKSTDSDRTDHTKREEYRCRKCKKIIDYAFGPAEPFNAIEMNKGSHKDLAHVNMCANTQDSEHQRLTNEKDEKIIAEWLQLNLQANQKQSKDSATLLEDLKSKSLAQAKTNVLLRVRDLDTILAAVEKKEKELHTKSTEGEDVNVVSQATAEEGKEETKPHDTTTETKKRLAVHTALATEEKVLKLQATAASKKDEDENILAPKIEVIDEVPLVEAAPKTDIFKRPQDFGPTVLNVTRFDKPGLHEIQAKIFDKIAQKYLQSPVKEIDGQLVKEISRFDVQNETKLAQEVVKSEPLTAELKAVNEPELTSESVDNSEHISLELKPEPIKPTELEIKINPSPAGERIVAPVISDENKPTPNDILHREFLGPANEGRVALRDIGARPILGYSVDEKQQEATQCEHKQPCHLFRKTLVDVFHTTEPKIGLLIREYPVPKKVCFEAPQYVTHPADKRTIAFDSEDWKYYDSSAAHHYTETTRYSAIEKVEEEGHVVQPNASPILADKQESTVNSKKLSKEEEPREPTRAAVEMAHSFIQAQPCTEPIHTKGHERKELSSAPITVDDSLPEIDLNDTSVSLTELLRRVRERNRILYCREVGLQMAKNMAALNPEGKCGDKKPPCPPPQPRCPPPPPPCPPPPPKCPPPCPPPKSKCPPAKCPPPCPPPPKCSPCPPPKNPCAKKDPCAKFKAQETITLVLHLGPLVNPGRKLIVPVLATNFVPAESSSHERPTRGFLGNLISQKLLLLKEILWSMFAPRPKELADDMIMLRMNRSRDFTPWSPIPSWPYPIINKKKALQCPQEGCPVDPPVNPAPKFQRPCPDKPCLDFPKR